MTRLNNKGFVKPALLTLSIAALAGIGYLTYQQLNPHQIIEKRDVDDLSISLDKIDENSLESLAAALYSSVLTENFTEVPNLVNRFKELQEYQLKTGKIKAYTGNVQESGNTEDNIEQNNKIDITRFLSISAIEKLEEKLNVITDKVLTKQHPESYIFYLNALQQILSFYEPKNNTEDYKIIKDSLNAYKAYKDNIDYTISDIRSIYGPIATLRMCRYLIGSSDYSKISPYELKFYLDEEIDRFIKQLPVVPEKKNNYFVNSDFINLTPDVIPELRKINAILPQTLALIPLLEGIKEDELNKDFQKLSTQLKTAVSSAKSFSNTAKTFYQCKATTSEDFPISIANVEKIFTSVYNIGGLSLNAIKVNLEAPLPGCNNTKKVTILVPDIKQYTNLFKETQNKISDSSRKLLENDVNILKKLHGLEKTNVTLLGSEIGAVELGVQAAPEQGMFIDKNDANQMFNIKLDSFALLKSYNIAPYIDLIFISSPKLTEARSHAIYKLNIIEDVVNLESSLDKIDYDSLKDPNSQYLSLRAKEIENIGHNYDTSTFVKNYLMKTTNGANIDTANNTITLENYFSDDNYDSSDSTSNVDSSNNDQEATTEIAKNEPQSEPNQPETVETPKQEEPKEVAKVEEKVVEPITPEQPTEIAKVEEPVASKQPTEIADNDPFANPEKLGENEENVSYSPEQLAEATVKVLKEQILLNNADAMYEYAIRLATGTKKVRKDIKLSTKYLKKATEAGHPLAMYDYATIIRGSKRSSSADLKYAKDLIIKAADNGNLKAMGEAGEAYAYGSGVKQDINKGISYLSKAAEHNDAKSQYTLAKIFLDGKLVPENKQKAFNLLKTSAKTNAGAAYKLAEIYEGKIIPNIKDSRLSDDNYVFAARHGYKDAYKKAGYILIETNSGQKEGMKFLNEIAGTDPEVDKILLNYFVVNHNTKQLAKLLLKSPKETQDLFPLEMGDIYAQGLEVAVNNKKAEEYYRKAMAQNIPDSFCRIGDMFYYGKSKANDLRAAVNNYNKGADYGSVVCAKQLAFIKIQYNKYRNLEEAFSLLSSLGDHEVDSSVRSVLGLMYLYGQGTKKDIKIGLAYLSKANTNEADFVRTLHSGDTSEMQKDGCKNPVLAGVVGTKTNNIKWTATGVLSDLFFLKDYKEQGGTFSYNLIYNQAVGVCNNNLQVNILHDTFTKFRKPESDNLTDGKDLYQAAMFYFQQKDYHKAFELMKKASEAGYTKAHNNLGIFYLLAIGTESNLKESYLTLLKGFSSKDAKATFNAAALRKYGYGTKPDHNKALDLVRTAIDLNYKIAIMHLGYSYDYGVGNGKNDSEAFNTFIKLNKL
ncbi:MAG: hypothetical protein ACI4V7_01205 [Succinivibrionaceae bacterium]